MPDPNPPSLEADSRLHGRADEARLLDRLVRDGHGALVLRGAAGVGKTALLRHAVAGARGYRVVPVRAPGTRPHAGLRRLCAALDGLFEQLPPHHARALRAATTPGSGPLPDPFTIGVATVFLVLAAAPLLCVLDDAQRLDEPSARALAFAARRLQGHRVVFLFAERGGPGALDDLPELVVSGVDRAGARAMVTSLVPGPWDDAVVERLVEETRGNPRAIRSAVPAVDPAAVPGGRPDSGTRERVLRLDPAGRTLLLAAAADPTGEVAVLWRAAARLGIPAVTRDGLVADGLLAVGELVTFPDPLVRGWVRHRATFAQRRIVHRALAEVTDPVTAADRRSWHHAHSVTAPDPAAADDLVAQVARARTRGGPRAAAAFLRVAATLSADPARRAERTLAAAAAELDAGRPGGARELLETTSGALAPAHRAEATRLRARLTFASTRTAAAAETLLRATRDVVAFDPAANQAYLDAVGAAVLTGLVAELPRSVSPSRVDSLVAALLVRGTEGFRAAAGPLTAALETARPSWVAGLVAAEVWDDRAWQRLAAGAADPGALPDVVTGRALFSVQTGDLAGAAALADEAGVMSAKLGQAPPEHATVLIAAWRGQDRVRASAEGLARTSADLAGAVLGNAVGDHRRALAAAQRVVERDELAMAGWALVELVEAAVGAGASDVAATALEALVARTSRCGTDWALGAEARCRALVAEGPAAAERYLEALRHLERTSIRTLRARTRLGYGEWLRRNGRADEAREPLRAAYDEFVGMGATAFADRAVRATGKRATPTIAAASLTPHENRVAALARDGLTNAEIGARVSISPRTVEYHLRKVFVKLGITSRAELHPAFTEHHHERREPGSRPGIEAPAR